MGVLPFLFNKLYLGTDLVTERVKSMYDNIDFKLKIDTVSGIDFLRETPRYLDKITGEHNFESGRVVSGILGDINSNHFKVTVSSRGVNIKDGSLCKFHLGDNFKTLSRSETQKAIEQLSDTLHLPIEKACVSRIDIAQNFIVQNPDYCLLSKVLS